MPEKLDELKKANKHFEKMVRELEEVNRHFREYRALFVFLKAFDERMKKDSEALVGINGKLAALLERIPEKKEEVKKP